MPVHFLTVLSFNLQKANVKKYVFFLRLVLTSLLFLKPQSLHPALPTQGPWDTHCNEGRANGSAGCTGVPILLSPSPCVPAPCMGKGRQPRMGEHAAHNTALQGQPQCKSKPSFLGNKDTIKRGCCLTEAGPQSQSALLGKARQTNKRRAGQVGHFLSHSERRRRAGGLTRN